MEIREPIFAQNADRYTKKTYKVLPCNGYTKLPLPSGATGHGGVIELQDIEAWKLHHGYNNIAARAETFSDEFDLLIVDKDIDLEKGKDGPANFAEYEKIHGELSPTWKTTAKGQGVAEGQFWYKVPKGTVLKDKPVVGVELIQKHHRIAVLPPSLHPKTLQPYRWYDPQGIPCDIPDPVDFPWLPDTYLQLWNADKKAPKAERKAPGTVPDLNEFEAWLNSEEPTFFVNQFVEEVNLESHIGHDKLLENASSLVCLQLNLGERGAWHAYEALKRRFMQTTGNLDNPNKEFRDAFLWALEVNNWSPQPLPSKPMREVMLQIQKEWDERRALRPELDFFSKRPELEHIRSVSRKLIVNPYALLMAVLLRVALTIPHFVKIKAYGIGSPINLYGVAVGPTGSGKSMIYRALKAYFKFPDDATFEGTFTAGSGEAIVDTYAYNKFVKDGDDGYYEFTWRGQQEKWFHWDEVSKLGKVNGRKGATVLEYLLEAFSSEQMGRVLANGKGIQLPEGAYKLVCSINAQPKLCDIFFTPEALASGWAGRFLFVNVINEYAREDFIDIDIEPFPVPRILWSRLDSFELTESMQKRLHESRLVPHESAGQEDETESHALRTEYNIAAALAALNGRNYLNDEDEELAREFWRHVKETKSSIRAALAEEARRANNRSAVFVGERNARSADVEYNRKIRRIAETIIRWLPEAADDIQTLSDIKKIRNNHIRSDEKAFFPDAISHLLDNPTMNPILSNDAVKSLLREARDFYSNDEGR